MREFALRKMANRLISFADRPSLEGASPAKIELISSDIWSVWQISSTLPPNQSIKVGLHA
jgi:hypothetical protein